MQIRQNVIKSNRIIFSLIFVVLCGSSIDAVAQAKKSSIGIHEKLWALSHPFKAKAAYKITLEVRSICDSLSLVHGVSGNSGGKLDAFRHSYWMALLRQKLRYRAALKLGIAHEKSNFKQFRKGRQEDNTRADSVLCAMDLHNNKEGLKIGEQQLGKSKSDIAEAIINAYNKGMFQICLVNDKDEFITCEGDKIDFKKFKNAWNVPRCLIKSADW
ncbi:MAG TPA: hypothetical protein PKH65_04920 [Bacteroidia bacterium]|nr:hypothetical protein [Bacteroidia bacterium]HNT80004.1 hypothetical protein [Bacteroidia bacterium]